MAAANAGMRAKTIASAKRTRLALRVGGSNPSAGTTLILREESAAVFPLLALT
jgi:hypothetical protein